MDPLGSTSGRLHGSALLGTQLALGQDAEGADPAQPAALRNFLDAVTRLERHINERVAQLTGSKQKSIQQQQMKPQKKRVSGETAESADLK